MKPRRLQSATISSIVTSTAGSLCAESGIAREATDGRVRDNRRVPIYEYRCANGHTFEVFQSMSEDPVSACVECGAPSERVLSAPAVHFKGSGFYTTDYARKGAKKSGSDGGGGSGDSSSSSEKSSSEKSSDASKSESKSKPGSGSSD